MGPCGVDSNAPTLRITQYENTTQLWLDCVAALLEPYIKKSYLAMKSMMGTWSSNRIPVVSTSYPNCIQIVFRSKIKLRYDLDTISGSGIFWRWAEAAPCWAYIGIVLESSLQSLKTIDGWYEYSQNRNPSKYETVLEPAPQPVLQAMF